MQSLGILGSCGDTLQQQIIPSDVQSGRICISRSTGHHGMRTPQPLGQPELAQICLPFCFHHSRARWELRRKCCNLTRNWQSGGASASAVPGLSDSIPPHMPRFVSSQNSVVQHPLVREFTQRRTRSCAADTGAHDTPTNSMICRSEFRSDAELIGVVSDRHGTADLS